MAPQIDQARAGALAEAFSAILKAWLSPEEMALVRARNSENPGDESCASHDFCDANEAMLAAFRQVMAREPLWPFDVEAGRATEAESEADQHLMNEAWSVAKGGNFS